MVESFQNFSCCFSGCPPAIEISVRSQRTIGATALITGEPVKAMYRYPGRLPSVEPAIDGPARMKGESEDEADGAHLTSPVRQRCRRVVDGNG